MEVSAKGDEEFAFAKIKTTPRFNVNAINYRFASQCTGPYLKFKKKPKPTTTRLKMGLTGRCLSFN